MFGKILIANRGEIACRIIRTARRLGVHTVAVCSEADRTALHARLADECVPIGPAPAAQSYLRIEAILEACARTGAEAVHPGYGFLSERADFAAAVQAAGLAFIGPNVRAIATMGDKLASKAMAATAGVATVPGHAGVVESAAEAARIAGEIGYPVMLKAAAGGGGKGMRVARVRAEVAEALARAQSEATAAFGDGRVLMEKFIVAPRHIEVQVLGDRHGNVVHLGERECSLQRRHQKLVEESPSPFVNADMRARMGAQAVAVAKAVGYDSAGTVEFIVGPDGAFYFLEMNTRLQVEHGVTELVTGLDLVELMLRVAAGEALPFAQRDVRLHGWAVECRINADDPERGFLPASGRITRYVPPAGVRLDSGVEAGSSVPVQYDSLLAKLLTHAPTRAEAIAAAAEALDRFALEGVRTNLPFLAALMAHPRWRAGALSTDFIAEEFPEGFAPAIPEGALALRFAAVAAAMRVRAESRERPGTAPHAGAWHWVVEVADAPFALTVEAAGDDLAVHFASGATLRVAGAWRPGAPIWEGRVDGVEMAFRVGGDAGRWRLEHAGFAAEVRVRPPREAELARLMPKAKATGGAAHLRAPMPGLVRAVLVAPGQDVEAGEALVVLEAMKVEITLRAAHAAHIAVLHAVPGALVAPDAVLVEFG